MKVRIYKPHIHAGKRYTPGPEGIEIEVAEHDARFLERAGLLTPPAIGTRPAAGEGSERQGVPAAGNVASNADDTSPAADPEADIPAPVGTAGTAAGGSTTVQTADPNVTRTVSGAAASTARSAGSDPTTRTTTPPARTGKK